MNPEWDLPHRENQAEINRSGREYCEQVLAESRRPALEEPADDTPLGRARRRAAEERQAAHLARLRGEVA